MSPDSPLRHPAFRAFLAARVCSVFGTQMVSVGIGWQLYALTGDAMDLGWVGLVQFLPQLLLFPVSGTVVDRLPRNRVLLACYATFLAATLLLVGLAHSGAATRTTILVAALLLALGRVFGAPAAQSLLPQVVPREEFGRAVSFTSSGFEVATICGPALGGLLYGLADDRGWNGAVVAFGTAGVFLVAAMAAALTLPMKRAEHAGKPPGLAEALDGIRFIWKRKIILSAITLDLFAVLFGGAVAILPVFAKDILQTGPEGLGILRAAPAVGSLCMALFLAWRPLHRNLGRTLYATVAVFGVATLVFGLSTSFWLSAAALFVTGASDEISVFIRMNVVQMATPDHVRGRVSAAEFVFIGASNELGAWESGLTASAFGAVPSVVFGGLGTLLTVLIGASVSHQLRRVDRLEDVRAEPVAQ